MKDKKELANRKGLFQAEMHKHPCQKHTFVMVGVDTGKVMNHWVLLE